MKLGHLVLVGVSSTVAASFSNQADGGDSSRSPKQCLEITFNHCGTNFEWETFASQANVTAQRRIPGATVAGLSPQPASRASQLLGEGSLRSGCRPPRAGSCPK